MKKNKKVVYIDMDDTIFDFATTAAKLENIKEEDKYIKRDPPCMYEPNFFDNLPVFKGAKEAINKIARDPRYEVYFASVPVAKSTISYTEKANSICKHFPHLYDRIILIQDKTLLKGEYLVDDQIKWEEGFGGNFIKFSPREPELSWQYVLTILNIFC